MYLTERTFFIDNIVHKILKWLLHDFFEINELVSRNSLFILLVLIGQNKTNKTLAAISKVSQGLLIIFLLLFYFSNCIIIKLHFEDGKPRTIYKN
jgi:hypothetical protein